MIILYECQRYCCLIRLDYYEQLKFKSGVSIFFKEEEEKLLRITLYNSIKFGGKVSCIFIHVIFSYFNLRTISSILQFSQENLQNNLGKRIFYNVNFCDFCRSKVSQSMSSLWCMIRGNVNFGEFRTSNSVQFGHRVALFFFLQLFGATIFMPAILPPRKICTPNLVL